MDQGEGVPAGGRPAILVDRSLLDVAPTAWLDGLRLHPFSAPEVPPDAEARGLLLRSTTRVTAGVLARLPRLRAVCTASSGTDHLDAAALASAGVHLGHGRGGNAEAVADHVLWALSRTWGGAAGRGEAIGRGLRGRRVVVVGCGAVGGRVMARLRGLGVEVVAVDPPRARREAGFASVTLGEALSRPVDALTLHVPLTFEGPDRTAGLVDAAVLDGLRGAALLNAARGGVLDEGAALRARRRGGLVGLCVDTFVGEPSPSAAFVRGCDLATPHVAGHSLEGKLRVAWLAIAALRRALGLRDPPPLEPELARLRAGRPRGDRASCPLRVLDALSERFRARAGEVGSFRALREGHARLELER